MWLPLYRDLSDVRQRHPTLTPLSNPSPFQPEFIQEYIDAGTSLADTLNFLVEKSELVRIDRPGFSIHHQSPFTEVIDILRVRRATGLMQRNGYKKITLLIAGNAAQEQHS